MMYRVTGTWVTISEPAWAHHHPSKSLVDSGLHSCHVCYVALDKRMMTRSPRHDIMQNGFTLTFVFHISYLSINLHTLIVNDGSIYCPACKISEMVATGSRGSAHAGSAAIRPHGGA